MVALFLVVSTVLCGVGPARPAIEGRAGWLGNTTQGVWHLIHLGQHASGSAQSQFCRLSTVSVLQTGAALCPPGPDLLGTTLCGVTSSYCSSCRSSL